MKSTRKSKKEVLKVDKLSREEQAKYKLHLKNLRDEASRLFTLKAEAEFKVREDEAKKNSISIAKSLKVNGADIELIIKSTGLSREEIEKL